MAINNTHYGYEGISKIMSSAAKVYFIGIGGISMSSLAIMTKKRGFEVAGSDRTRTALTEHLEAQGIDISYGQKMAFVDNADVVVYTVAIDHDNEDYAYAQKKRIPCISRADYLGYLMMDFSVRIGVSGTHGKSTTTGMLASIFTCSQTDPTVLCGAQLDSLGGEAYRCGDDNAYIIVESCEYQDSFLDFYPNIAVVLNVELDHVDYFSSLSQIKNSFAVFAEKCGEEGSVIANADDENCMDALVNSRSQLITFGVKNDANFKAVNIEYENGFPRFDILYENEPICNIKLSVSGEHNILNATAAFAVAFICGIEVHDISEGLSRFRGAHRRCEYLGKYCGADVFDDYAHHPTEIRTTLDGITARGYNRVICVFQPHTFSRTKGLFGEISASFSNIDEVIYADIYPARETDDLGMHSSLLASNTGENAKYLGNLQSIKAYLSNELRDGDALVVMGAGDIYRLYPMLGFDYKG